MNVLVIVAVIVLTSSANPWDAKSKKAEMDSQRKYALSVTKNRKSEESKKSALRSKELTDSENWVQYALYDKEDCSGTSHYYYWQATDVCAEAEYIAGYNPSVTNYVKVACVDAGNYINITNTYYPDSNCSNTIRSNTVSVMKTCGNQTVGAFYQDQTDSSDFDEYDMTYGDMMATACVTGDATPWTSTPLPNGQLSMYYEDIACITETIAADLFVSNVCSEINDEAFDAAESGILSKCSTTDLCGSSWDLYSSTDCTGAISTSECSYIYTTDFCGAETDSSNSVSDNLDVMQDCIGDVSSAASLAINIGLSTVLVVVTMILSI